jgi:hypothetical protein
MVKITTNIEIEPRSPRALVAAPSGLIPTS